MTQTFVWWIKQIKVGGLVVLLTFGRGVLPFDLILVMELFADYSGYLSCKNICDEASK